METGRILILKTNPWSWHSWSRLFVTSTGRILGEYWENKLTPVDTSLGNLLYYYSILTYFTRDIAKREGGGARGKKNFVL